MNWLIAGGIIAAFVLQTMSVREQRRKLPAKLEAVKNMSIEELAADLDVHEKDLKKIEQAAEEQQKRLDEIFEQTGKKVDLKEQIIKHALLSKYFVQAKVWPFVLNGWEIKGLFGHMWLHAGIIHLLGNMLFLRIFGNAVCSKIRNISYLPVYVGLGLVAAISHLVLTGRGGMGASGAINGIIGMYLVFFWENEITCYFIFFFPIFVRPYVKEFCVSSIWIILLWLIFDIWGAIKGGGRVAYFAHLGGFAAGFGLGILMLKLKLIQMEHYERSILQIFERKEQDEDYKPFYKNFVGTIQSELENEVTKAGAAEEKLQTVPFEPEKPTEEFIRFTCQCGKRFKAPMAFAGKTGKCPKCKGRVKIPQS